MGEEKSANQKALLATIRLIVDGAKDIEKALEPNQSLFDRIKDFENLIPDAIEEFKQFGDLKQEISLLQPSDIPALASVLVADLQLQDAHAQAIASACLKVIEDASNGIGPDIMALISAIKGPEAAPAAPTPEA
jgi:hypothetical protein